MIMTVFVMIITVGTKNALFEALDHVGTGFGGASLSSSLHPQRVAYAG